MQITHASFKIRDQSQQPSPTVASERGVSSQAKVKSPKSVDAKQKRNVKNYYQASDHSRAVTSLIVWHKLSTDNAKSSDEQVAEKIRCVIGSNMMSIALRMRTVQKERSKQRSRGTLYVGRWCSSYLDWREKPELVTKTKSMSSWFAS